MKIILNKEKIKKSIKLTIILLFSLITFLYLNYNFSFFIPCIFHELTGFLCPGCGITRMFISIIILDFYQAFRYNPLVFVLLPFFLIYGTIYYINWIQDKKFHINKKIWYFLLIIAIIFMILRNIPMFDYLKPTIIN